MRALAWLALVVGLAARATSAARQLPTDARIGAVANEDALEKVAKLILPHGYPLEVHRVQTADGFVLTLLRIPHGAAGAARTTTGTRTSATTHPHEGADHAGASSHRRSAATSKLLSAAAAATSTSTSRISSPTSSSSSSSSLAQTLPSSFSSRSASDSSSSSASLADRPVVLLQHGLLDSAAGYLVNGPGRSLAFLLADEGYDVWLGNMRGNSLSRAHVSLDPSDEEFWMWSYDEMAEYDMPAMIRFILDSTGARSLRYVGHSQGTTVLLAALAGAAGPGRIRRGGSSEASGGGGRRSSSSSSGGEKEAGRVSARASLSGGEVERAVLLAPVAVAKHISSVPLLALAAMDTDDMFSLLGLHEFLPSQEVAAALEGALCVAQPSLCVSFLAALCGYNPDNLDNSRLPLYLSYTPAGTSVQNMAHWSQAVRSRAPNTMSFFDYGTNCASRTGRCNQLEYGSLAPPRYNLTAITTPLALFSGTQDRLSDPLDMEYLLESLGPGVVRQATILRSYEHLDFIWGIDAKEAIYDDVLRFLAGEEQPQPQQ